MTDNRKDCPMRHENGNCTVAGGFCTSLNDPICEALHNAYDCGYRHSALREQDGRENGCEYCTDNKNIYHLSSGIHDSMDEDVYISGNALVVDIGCHSYGSSVIKFCPICGRRLPDPQKEDA